MARRRSPRWSRSVRLRWGLSFSQSGSGGIGRTSRCAVATDALMPDLPASAWLCLDRLSTGAYGREVPKKLSTCAEPARIVERMRRQFWGRRLSHPVAPLPQNAGRLRRSCNLSRPARCRREFGDQPLVRHRFRQHSHMWMTGCQVRGQAATRVDDHGHSLE